MTFLSTDNNGALKVAHAQHSINDLTDANDSGKAVGSLLIWDGSNWVNYNRLATRVYKSGNATVNDSTLTLVSFDSEDFDYGSQHSTVTNTSRVTAAEAGIFLVCAGANFASSGPPNGGERLLMVRKNAAGSGGGGTLLFAETQNGTASPTDSVMGASDVFVLSANDYIELFVYQHQGASITLQGGIGATSLAMTRIA